MSDFLADLITGQFLTSALVLVIGAHVVLVMAGLCVYFERKVSAYIQDRLGPNRTGLDLGLPFLWFLKGMAGLGQGAADGLKFFLKEDYTPTNVDKVLFTLAPVFAVIPALLGFVILPWGGYWSMPEMTLPLVGWTIGGEVVSVAGAEVSVGIVYLLAVASVGVYGVTLGGWASNNKYSMLGGLRCTAQMISYEIPMGVALLCVLLVAGSFVPNDIIAHQSEHGWLILAMPAPAILFYICTLAEANRAPFDNAEAEQELVGGFHTEYSSMRFALYPLAEYSHFFVGSAFFVLLFLGGYSLPFVEWTSVGATGALAVLLKIGVFMVKTLLVVFLGMLVRWTIPRVRYDQVMMLGWGAMIPASLLMIVVTSVMVYMGWTSTLELLLANVVMLAVIFVGRSVLASMFGRSIVNHKIPLYGSRFSPVPGVAVSASPTHPMALEDRPVQGTEQHTQTV
jgi:NADH-quinone oxidoreductase subunit H